MILLDRGTEALSIFFTIAMVVLLLMVVSAFAVCKAHYGT